LKLATLKQISVAKPAVTPTTSSPPSVSPSPAPTHHSHTGAIVGGVVGGIAGVAIVAAILFYFFRRRRHSRHGQQVSAEHAPPAHELPSEHKHELEQPVSEMADPPVEMDAGHVAP
jgi:hypothetical protein